MIRYVRGCLAVLRRVGRRMLASGWQSLADRALVRRYEAKVLFDGHRDLLEADRYLNQWYRD